MDKPKITAIETYEFTYEVRNVNPGMPFYEPGAISMQKGAALKIHTNMGLTGEYVTHWGAWDITMIPLIAGYLIGKDPLEREKLYTEIKLRLKSYSRMGLGLVDTVLWDIAGKYYNAPIYELLGGYRKALPCYASTLIGDNSEGGLSSPEAYADFAEQCLEMGYKAFKIHDWQDGLTQRTATAVHAVAKRVGGKMDLMLDPSCSFNTFADGLKVGKVCDEESFFWYEDPFRDGGVSQFAHRKLRQLIRTPLLITELHRGLEPKVDFALADATDYLRGDPASDGGITGVMKLAHAAEALGIDVELHLTGPDRRHCMAAMRNSNYYEMGLVHPNVLVTDPPVYTDGYAESLDAIDENGCVPVPEGPGLGVEYDWEYVRKRQTASATYT